MTKFILLSFIKLVKSTIGTEYFESLFTLKLLSEGQRNVDCMRIETELDVSREKYTNMYNYPSHADVRFGAFRCYVLLNASGCISSFLLCGGV